MIKSLRIRNLATIEELELELENGFSILTGETGAGKSIIIDAIRLILGDKGSPDCIRTGRTEASVEAVIEAPEMAARLKDLGLEDGEELLVQRQISGQGPGKAYINGVFVPVRKLKEAGTAIADIYGQNDHVFLLHLENHLIYLDAFLDAGSLREEVSRAARELKSILLQKRELESKSRERDQRLDFLAYQVREIEGAGLRPGEDEELVQNREILKNAGKIAGLVDQALDLSYAQEDSILPLLSKFKNVLKELVPYYPSLESSGQSVEEFGIAFRELSHGLMKFKEGNMGTPDDIEVIEERLNIIDKLKRKYGPGIPEVLSYLEGIKVEENALVSGRERLEGLEEEIAKKFKEYVAKAGKLAAVRVRGAKELAGIMEKEIAILGMNKAAFKVEVRTIAPALEDPATIREDGTDEVEFLISPNPGEELRPLRKIASGGELSRVMLALKSIGKEAETARTLIFDEIDSGIGGGTADFIAGKLEALSRKHQVICITHLPQIAAAAAHQFRIDKRFEKGRTYTSVRKLQAGERVEEIARLISGARISEASLQTAREMLAGTLAGKKTARSRSNS
jgi:DNA repair protein RecN (Recombination protein N)